MIRQLPKKVSHNLFARKITFVRWKFNLLVFVFISLGTLGGIYLGISGLLSRRLFASTSSWNQTDWSGGVGSSTTNQYSAASNIDDDTGGEFKLATQSGWYNSSWNYRKKITIDHTKVGANLENFPVLVSFSSDSDLAADAQDDFDDILFTDSGGTKLDHEIEEFDAGTGELVAWVRIPSLPSSADTEVYLYYGNSSAANQENVGGVWDSNHQMVQHLQETSGTVYDSTSNDNDGTQSGGVTQDAAGKVNGADSFDGSDDYISLPDNIVTLTNDFSVELWVKPDDNAQNPRWLSMKDNTTNFQGGHMSSDTVFFRLSDSVVQTSYTLSYGGWFHVVWTLDSGTRHVYINGESKSHAAGGISANASFSSIGAGYSASSYTTDGVVDEVRISNTARSAEWISTSYSNQNDPGSFYSLASEESKYASSATLTSNIYDTGYAANWGDLTYTTSGSGTTTVKVRSDSSSDMSGATAWASCSTTSSGTDLSGTDCVTDTHQYIQYQVSLAPSGANTPVFEDIDISFAASDIVDPPTNASDVVITNITSGNWTSTEPTITWTAGADDEGGEGILGYCISLDGATIGSSNTLDPESAAGALTGIDDGVANNSCPYIATGTSINLANVSGLSLTSGKQYYFSIKAVDAAGNVWDPTTGEGEFQDRVSFKYHSDSTAPETAASSVAITGLDSGAWTNSEPTLTWTAGADNEGGVGVLGYCISLDEATIGSSNSLNPASAAGALTGKDDGVSYTYCPYVVTSTSVDLSSIPGLTLVANKQYYFSIKVVDLVGNTYSGASGNWQDQVSFKYAGDSTAPTNASSVAITGLDSGAWTNSEPTITWTAGADDDGGSGLLGYCLTLDEATIGSSNSLNPVTSAGTLAGIDDGVDSNECPYISTGTSIDLSAIGGLDLTSSKQYYFSIRAIDNVGNASTTNFQDQVSFKYADDSTAPSTNASGVAITNIVSGNWASYEPTITWTAGADNTGGSGLLGYCISLDEATIGSSTTLDPASSAGALAGIDDGVDNNSCPYIVTSTSINLSTIPGLTLTDNKQYYFSIKAIDNLSYIYSGSSANYQDLVSFKYAEDSSAPTANASSVGITGVTSGAWTNSEPTLTWTAGEDAGGLLGYCISLDEATVGSSSSLDPTTSSGALTSLDDGISYTYCPFIVTGTSVDLSSITGLSLTTNRQYYFSVKAVDNAGNFWSGESADFQDLVSFKYDGTSPTNPTGLSAPQTYQSSIDGITIYWTTSGSSAAQDDHSGVKGYQYKIGSGTWYGSSHTGNQDGDDLITTGSYTLDETYDTLSTGESTFYLRTYDNVCNVSTESITVILKYSGDAPSEPQNLAASPASSTSNSFAFSWEIPASYDGLESGLSYCYTVNVLPSSVNCNWTSDTSLSASSYATQPSTNTMYIVPKDEAGNINYSAYASTNFTCDTSAPGVPQNIDIADVSVKATSSWKLAISWEAPASVGAGVSTYELYHSSDGTTYSLESSTSGISYVDTSLTQGTHYYKVKACDSAHNCGAFSSVVSLYPDGKYTSAAELTSGPATSGITTKKAAISWSTDRNSDSKVQYGTSSGSYLTEEPSNSTQATSHTINLTSLSAGTTYYYRARWTDEDGNLGTSGEKSFQTDAAPTVKDVEVTNIGLSSALLNYTVTGSSKVKIYYGKTSSFGAYKEATTSTSESSYSTQLSDLEDGVKYYFKINAFDSESEEYEGTILDFETLPRPRISNVRLQEIRGTAQPTLLVTWESNTEISSIVTYYPQGQPSQARDEVNVKLVEGEHKMLLRSLFSNTIYNLVVKGRDKIGNEARSTTQTFTTATDTRPPVISNLRVEGVVQGVGDEAQAQLLISFNTDEPATGQVEFGEGTGTTYSQKTQEDTRLTLNHLVVISNLAPSKVYHLRAVTKDNAGNVTHSVDTVAITPKATRSALDLVITNLSDVFGFLGGLER